MKTGVFIGGFCPMHRGHLDVIMRCKKENEKCFIIVYGYDEEPRAKQIGLSTNERFRIISKFFKGDEQISVKMLNYQTKPSWGQLLKDMLSTINGSKNEIMMYVGEAAYCNMLTDLGYNCVYTGLYTNISATKIRNNPASNMHLIVSPFKKYLKQCILLSGASSTGKSTCAKDLAKYFNGGYSEEYSRGFAERQNKPLIECCKKRLIEYFILQQNIQTLNKLKRFDVVFADGDTISNLSYAKLAANSSVIPFTEDDYEDLKFYGRNHRCYNPNFTNIFLFAPKKEFVEDGIRNMVGDWKIRVAHFEILCQLYEEFGYSYKILDGDYWKNFNEILNSI